MLYSNILTTILLYETEKKSTITVLIDLYFGDGRETKSIIIYLIIVKKFI